MTCDEERDPLADLGRLHRPAIAGALGNQTEERVTIHELLVAVSGYEALMLRARVEAVLEIHKNDGGLCLYCNAISETTYRDWPCPTVRALDGEEGE